MQKGNRCWCLWGAPVVSASSIHTPNRPWGKISTFKPCIWAGLIPLPVPRLDLDCPTTDTSHSSPRDCGQARDPISADEDFAEIFRTDARILPRLI